MLDTVRHYVISLLSMFFYSTEVTADRNVTTILLRLRNEKLLHNTKRKFSRRSTAREQHNEICASGLFWKKLVKKQNCNKKYCIHTRMDCLRENNFNIALSRPILKLIWFGKTSLHLKANSEHQPSTFTQ